MQFLDDLRARLKFVEYLESLDEERQEAFAVFAKWFGGFHGLEPQIALEQAQVASNLRFMAGWQRLDQTERHNVKTWFLMSESAGKLLPPSSVLAGSLFDAFTNLGVLEEFEQALSSTQQTASVSER
ncbi:hypothetical protein C4587_00635 [Candidatus Parcubacteria bacterium]|nr:MAG: hypothetical protein C4587_00635 [Candidatus Parcubacteria bacterium]